MASLLINNQLKSIYVYLVIILLFICGFIYWFYIKQPSVSENFHEQAFYLNYSAFKSSIYLANIKYLSQKENRQKIDVWQENSLGLDYNYQGFPIGTSIKYKDQNSPLNNQDCMDIWRFLMSSLLTTKQHKNYFFNYSAQLNMQKNCEFYYAPASRKKIVYHPEKGKVFFHHYDNKSGKQ